MVTSVSMMYRAALRGSVSAETVTLIEIQDRGVMVTSASMMHTAALRGSVPAETVTEVEVQDRGGMVTSDVNDAQGRSAAVQCRLKLAVTGVEVQDRGGMVTSVSMMHRAALRGSVSAETADSDLNTGSRRHGHIRVNDAQGRSARFGVG
ncbi:hypothetical protein V5799_022198 [Amblyomma americanum]|uniref:Uncharacterized protein n=1 Tax=Amblyomma americanum TaxID=6943 RepID=A0AAQ4FMR8_AMBAM